MQQSLVAPFALTKIQAPRLRPGLIERQGLEARLGQALREARLTLLAAPAGFGKTAALTRQLAQLEPGTAVAWLAADADDDLPRLAACLVAALDAHDLPWRVSPEALVAALDADRGSRQALASELLNALAATEVPRGLIVIDDAHRIEDPAAFDFLAGLIERLPAHWGVVIASRVDPPALPLARWRAQGELAEVRQDELRFTPLEVGSLMQARHAPDDLAEHSEALFERTQGWPAGLGLALSSAGRSGPSTPAARALRGAASDRLVFDYLASEVLDGMPERLRLFLLRCSVLPELSLARCAAVSLDPQAAHWLDQIERRGLFVSVLEGEPGGERSLRLHDLFRDCLDDRLRRDLPEELPVLLRRAAEAEPDAQRRIGYLLRAGDFATAEADLGSAASRLISMGAAQQVLRLIEQFPPALRLDSPGLAFAEGLAHWSRWDFEAQANAMRRAAEAYARRGERRGEQRSRAYLAVALSSMGQPERGQAAREALAAEDREAPLDLDVQIVVQMMRAWGALEGNELEALAPAFERTVALLEQADRAELWFAAPVLPVYVGLPEMTGALRRHLAGMARHVSDQPTPLRATARAVEAALAVWDADPGLAASALAAAEEDSRWLGAPMHARTFTQTFAALLHAWRGEAAPALALTQALLDDLELPASRGRAQVWRTHYLMLRARVALLVRADDVVRECERRLREGHFPHERAILRLQRESTLPGHVALLDGRLDAAAQLYTAALAEEPSLQVLGQAVEIRLRLGVLLLRLRRRGEAVAVLNDLAAYLPGRVRPGAALMAGIETLEALQQADLGDALDAGVRERLAAWHAAALRWREAAPAATRPSAPAAVARLAAAAGPSPAAPSLDALSPRERDVLARIAAGDSNKLIARTLELSPHTVKRHVANILDKLGLASRGQAAAWFAARPSR